MRTVVPFVAGVAAGLVVLIATDGSDIAFIGACLVAVAVVELRDGSAAVAVTGLAIGVAIGVGIAAFGVGLLAGVTVRRRPDAARERLIEIEHAELRRLRAQRRAARDVLDRASQGEFGMFGLAPVTEVREALGIDAPQRRAPEFGRGNAGGAGGDDPATGVIEP